VTTLVEAKRAQLVVIASDVDPIEIVVWLPVLCRRLGVRYVIVKTKACLSGVVGQRKHSIKTILLIFDGHKSCLTRICRNPPEG
jgi:large subunit ribosomal protein L7Ae